MEFTSRADPCQNFLTEFDFSSIETLDPSLASGHRLIYDKEVPIEFRSQDSDQGPQEIGSLEPVRCKLLIRGPELDPEHIRVELSSDNDLFFHYTYNVEPATFSTIQQNQKLVIDFADYPTVLMKMFNSCIREPHSFLAIFVLAKDGVAKLDFVQNLEYRFVQLLSIEFQQSHAEDIRVHAAYRFNAQKSKLSLMKARLQDIYAVLKTKNPALLLYIRKAHST